MLAQAVKPHAVLLAALHFVCNHVASALEELGLPGGVRKLLL